MLSIGPAAAATEGPTRNGPQMFTGAVYPAVHGGTFQSANKIVNINSPPTFQKGLDILREHVAVGALHNSAERLDPPKCYPKTREAILAKIEAWVRERPENRDRLVLWMYGPAGAGKSAIAQSIAELCKSLLAASFFFSRTAPDRRDNSRLVATLVWQLIKAIPEIRESVLSTLEHDPTLLYQTPATQMKCLIVDPMNQVPRDLLEKHPRLVIIDGLDECFPPESQDNILNILSTSLQDLITPLYFLVASRPHINIHEVFTSNPFRSMTHTLPLEDDYQSTQDICHFLTSSFAKIRAKHAYLPSPWPKTGDIEVLLQKSSGQFIYAATIMRYIARGHHGHEERLKIVLELQSLDNSASPFAVLDALYLQILRSVGEDQIGKVMEVLGALIFLRENNINQVGVLEGLFNYRRGELVSVMGDMLALVHVPNSQYEMVKIYHASLPDFLLDHIRSQSFHLDCAAVCLNLARRCIKGRVFRSENTSHNKYQSLNLRYIYEKIFTECITTSPFTEDLSGFLLGFSLWDGLPARFPLFTDQDIGQMSLSLLEKFHWPGENSKGWAKILEAQLGFLDRWIYQVFSSAPHHLLPMILTACSIYIGIEGHRTFSKHKHKNYSMLTSLLSHFGLEVDWPGYWSADDPPKLLFLFPRIPLVFERELRLTSSHYTEFAIWCAKHVSQGLRKDGSEHGPEYADFKIGAPWLYLAESLPHCQESDVLVGLLKYDTLAEVTLLPEYTNKSNIVEKTLQYLERSKHLFEAKAKQGNSDATELPPETCVGLSLEKLQQSDIACKSGLRFLPNNLLHPATIINDEQLVQESLLRSGLQPRPAVSFMFYAVAFSIFLISEFLSSRHLSK